MLKLSVLMSVYAKEKVNNLSEALQSLITQTVRAGEVVLVEDGVISSELTAVIDLFRTELNIVSVHLEKNSGLAVALNKGLKYCSYEFIARMDTDDIACQARFEKQIELFRENVFLDVVGTFSKEIDLAGNTGNIRRMPVSHNAIYDNLFACPLIHPSVMFKKSSIEKIGGYDETLLRRQDYDLWFRCAKAGMIFYNIPEPLLLYRFDESTHKRQNTKLMIDQAMIGYRGVMMLDQPYWKALACFWPVFRSLLPGKLRHFVYVWTKLFDPRQRGES